MSMATTKKKKKKPISELNEQERAELARKRTFYFFVCVAFIFALLIAATAISLCF